MSWCDKLNVKLNNLMEKMLRFIEGSLTITCYLTGVFITGTRVPINFGRMVVWFSPNLKLSKILIILSLILAFLYAMMLNIFSRKSVQTPRYNPLYSLITVLIGLCLYILGIKTLSGVLYLLTVLQLFYARKKELLLSLAYTYIPLGVLSLLRWTLFIVNPSRIYSGSFWELTIVETTLFSALSLLSPYLLILNLFLSLLIFRRSYEKRHLAPSRPSHLVDARKMIILLLLALTLTSLPYIFSEGTFYGVDFTAYVIVVKRIFTKNPWGTLYNILRSDRPFFYLVVWFSSNIPGVALENLLYYMPVALVPLILISLYYYSSRLFPEISLMAPLIFLLSPTFTVGLYGAFLANLLALVLGFIMLLFFEKHFEGHLETLIASLLSLVVYYTHPYTWSVFVVSYLCKDLIKILLTRKIGFRRKITFAPLIGIPLVLDALRKVLLGTLTGAEYIANVGHKWLSLYKILRLFSNLHFTFYKFGSSFFSNFFIYATSLLGTYYVLRNIREESLIISAWSVTVLPVILFGDGQLQARILLNYPLFIVSALGLKYFIRKLSIEKRRIILMAYLLVNMNYTIRCIANLILLS